MSKRLDLRKIRLDNRAGEEVTRLHQILSSWETETQARKELTYQELLDEENGWVSYEIERERRRKEARIERGRIQRR